MTTTTVNDCPPSAKPDTWQNPLKARSSVDQDRVWSAASVRRAILSALPAPELGHE